MEIDCREILALTFNLAKQQQELIGKLVSISHEMAQCWNHGVDPTREQVQAWDQVSAKVKEQLWSLQAAFASVEQAVAPFHFDS